jgi:hypothetical protein
MTELDRKPAEHPDTCFAQSPASRGLRRFLCGVCFLGALAALGVGSAGKPPWQRRIGRDVAIRHRLSYQYITPDLWPKEPKSPESIARDRFKAALATLCDPMPDARLETYTDTLLAAGRTTLEDPFLLAALMYQQSGCRPKTPEHETRRGLTRVSLEMHAPHIRGGQYRYFLGSDGAWQPHALPLNGIRFNEWDMEKPVKNLTFAALALSIFKKQCRDLDRAFGGVPHRHHVSHWFFGDKVRHTEPEDAVLTARRRLLGYYAEEGPAPAGRHGETPLVSPLDGAPRLMLDYFGNKRGTKGSPGHQGIDIAGLTGEPVRSIADGKITFAGADMKGGIPSRQTTPAQAAAIPAATLGNGGLWVTVNHGNGFRSCYMHLTATTVTQGDQVKAGDIIGALGNSGTRASGPHLHLEFRVDEGGRADPAAYLQQILVNPFKTPHR